MLKGLGLLVLFLAFAQTATERPVVSRLYATTAHDANLIYAYAGRAFPEGKPVPDGAVECFISQLKETGLFTDVWVKFKPIDEGKKVDVYIEPRWSPRWESFAISEITIGDLPGLDKPRLQAELNRVGFQSGSPLLHVPFSKIKSSIEATIHETYKDDPDSEDEMAGKLLDLSYRLRLVAPERVVLELSWNHKENCP